MVKNANDRGGSREQMEISCLQPYPHLPLQIAGFIHPVFKIIFWIPGKKTIVLNSENAETYILSIIQVFNKAKRPGVRDVLGVVVQVCMDQAGEMMKAANLDIVASDLEIVRFTLIMMQMGRSPYRTEGMCITCT